MTREPQAPICCGLAFLTASAGSSVEAQQIRAASSTGGP